MGHEAGLYMYFTCLNKCYHLFAGYVIPIPKYLKHKELFWELPLAYI